MEKLYTVSKKQDWELTVTQIMNSLCQIQTYIEESRENHYTIQVRPKSNPLWLYSGSRNRFKGLNLTECLNNYGQRFVVPL